MKDLKRMPILMIFFICTGGIRMSEGIADEADREAYVRCVVRRILKAGDRWYDRKSHLILRNDDQYRGRANIAQNSPEYAAALLDADTRISRANNIIGAMLDHQWLRDKGTRWYGNFIWWHDLKKPEDQNAVAFMSPWLCYYLLQHNKKLTDEIRERLLKALPLCLQAVRAHTGPVHYDNIWFLKAASLVMIGRATEQPLLIRDAERMMDTWIRYVSRNGINEFNSPTYAAVNIYALEFMWRFVPASKKSFRKKIKQLLNFCYADIFQNWHWDAGIGAGTHSRAYPRDRLTGKSLISYLIHRQCGGKLRAPARPFEYNFIFSDYTVPAYIRAWARKEKKTPMTLRASHPCWGNRKLRVDRSLYVLEEVTLATQTGYRANSDQAIPFKITYAGSQAKQEERATFITPVPPHDPDSRTRGSITFAHHQEGSQAIVLYEADIKGCREKAYLRLVIDPSKDGDMVEEILVNGKPYTGNRRELKPGSVIAWRVGKAAAAVRLLDAMGVDPGRPVKRIPKNYVLTPVKDAGLCLHCLVCYRPKRKVAVNDLSCGFAVQVAPLSTISSLADLSEQAAEWSIAEKHEHSTRDITWTGGKHALRLRWKGESNRVTVRQTDGRDIGRFPLYESPLIHLKRGGRVRVRTSRSVK